MLWPRFILYLGGVFFIGDRFFKHQALGAWKTAALENPYFGWQPHLNPGIAFGLPLPNSVTLAFTIPTIFFLGVFFLRSSKQRPIFSAGLAIIILGAASNLIDRVLYQHTVDYFFVFRSIFNLADVLIICGFLLLLLPAKKQSVQ